MKEIEVQTENKDKEIIQSSKIKVDEDNRIKVIVTVGDPYGSHPSIELLEQVHKCVTNAIENNKTVITVPSFVKINTIKI